MGEKMKWSQAQTEKLILLVQQNECIFNIKSKDYVDRDKKYAALNTIANEMQVDLQEVKRKWKNLRTQYVKELREVRHSKKSGAGLCDVYSPKLWCFSQLQFLESHTYARKGESNYEGGGSSQNEQQSVENPSTSSQANFPCEDMASSQSAPIEVTTNNSSEGPPRKRAKKDNPMCQLRKDLCSLKQKIGEKQKRPFAWLGNLVEAQMEKLAPERQDDAAWEVQCLLRRLTQNTEKAYAQSIPEDELEDSMIEILYESDFE